MKKVAIISVSAVLLIAVVIGAAFAFWDTDKGSVTFEANSIGSAITLNATPITDTKHFSDNKVAGYGKNLVSNDAIVGSKDAKLVCVGATKISLTSNYDESELTKLVKSLKYTVTAFTVANVGSISKANFSDTFDLYVTTSASGAAVTGKALFKAGEEMLGADKVLVPSKMKTETTLYVFLAYRTKATDNKTDLNVDGANLATKKIDITITFTIA